VVFDDTVDMLAMARYALEFCAHESCGKCAPCRIGSVRGAEALEQAALEIDRESNLALVEELCDTMAHASLCGLGGMTPYPVRSAMQHFGEDFGPKNSGG
jgi:formate dehydrogenase iron-sulfur subunit